MTRCITRLMAIAALILLGASQWSIESSAAQPVLDGSGHRFSCPDPSVENVPVFHPRYTMACTSDYQRNAYPIYQSTDLKHWHFVSDVFPAGHQPVWALPSPSGRYWAPEIHWIGHQWVVYFAVSQSTGAMAIGVAWSRTLQGPWSSKRLHWVGQFNGFPGTQKETYGGVIDPTETVDPQTGQRYLFWAEQHFSIWGMTLSSDGLNLVGHHPHMVLWAHEPYDCDSPDYHDCTIEGPAAFFKQVHGRWWCYLLYSARSTWLGSYEMRATASADPLGVFNQLSHRPILQSGHGWLAPGGGSRPVHGPHGHRKLLYHAIRKPSHVSESRIVLIGQVRWVLTSAARALQATEGLPGLPVPIINDGLAA